MGDTKEKILNAPNVITIFRVVLAIIIVVFVYFQQSHGIYPWNLLAFSLFVVASLSDSLDGYLARRNNQITNFGRLFDPLADKFLVSFVFIALTDLHRVPGWITIIIIGRDIAITGLRGLAAEMGVVIQASNIGKYKTLFEILSIGGYIYYTDLWIFNGKQIGDYTVGFAIIFALWSGLDYFIKFWKVAFLGSKDG